MVLQSSGTITLAQIQTEFGGSNPASLSEYYRGGSYVPNTSANSGIPTSGTISFSQFYGGNGAATSGTFSPSGPLYRDNAALNTVYTSANRTVSVVNGPINISANSGALIKNLSTGSAFSAGPIAFNNGNVLQHRRTSSSSYSAGLFAYANMAGSSSAYFLVTTGAAPSGGGGGGGGKKCLALTSPVIIKGVGAAADRVTTVANIAVDDRLTAFTEPTMLDEGDPNWAAWTVANLDNATDTTSTVVKATPYIVGEWIRVNGQLECTVPHPFLVYRDSIWQWIEAGDLVAGDELLGHDGSNVAVTLVEEMSGMLDVMNVGVETVDTYYAGTIDGVYILNHNK